MSIMLTTPFNEIPIEFVEYGMSHAAQGTTIVIMQAMDEEGYHWIATGEDSDLDKLTAAGYEMVQVYAPMITPLIDNDLQYTHSDDRCC